MAVDDIMRNPFGLLKLSQLLLLVISIGCVFGVANGWWYFVGAILVASFLNTIIMLICYFWKQSFEDSFLELSHSVFFVVSLFIGSILLFTQPGFETAPWKHYNPAPTPTLPTPATTTTTAAPTEVATTPPRTTTTVKSLALLSRLNSYGEEVYKKEDAFIAGGFFCLLLCLSYGAELYFLIQRLLNHRGRPTPPPPTHVTNQNATDLPPNIPVGSQPGA